jgi:hypothetical protein
VVGEREMPNPGGPTTAADGPVCPKCGTRRPPGRLLMKCVVCEAVYCPACQDVPGVHPFWCHEDRGLSPVRSVSTAVVGCVQG